jgi:hypothetical protein
MDCSLTRLTNAGSRRWLLVIGLIAFGGASCSDDSGSGADQSTGRLDGGQGDQQTVDQAIDKTAADQALSDSASSDIPRGARGVLRNAPTACTPPILMFGSPSDAGYWAATRLTPPRYPFFVEEIRYTLGTSQTTPSETICAPHLAHRMEVFKASTIMPPATPKILGLRDVAASKPLVKQALQVKVKLQLPVVLTTGEHLFVQVQLVRNGKETLCLESCTPPTPLPDRDFWSYAAKPPFGWKSMSREGVKTVFSMEAVGTFGP